ncbi:putative GRAM domain, PH domain-containing protein [Rosa chinensis]|uniref:Putative GRAM domain, PH domain-containing protein n=1 Tax=Rosa chinensis TaxID=74649 RepID=A0A2P6R4T3_ROSCH|nr:GEM-like protein 7 [Rosa chinensis]PRQ41445.1 putative GRAM domain, PH domain-containing protein [Rosa chinensis]
MKASFQVQLGGQVLGYFPINSAAAASCTFERSPMNAKRLLLPAQHHVAIQYDHVPSSDHRRDQIGSSKRTQMKLRPKISETVKGKLRLGAKILRAGGTMEKVFKHLFSNNDKAAGEKLLKTCHCYLSTTAGPIAGLLFISTHKIAFCSDKPIKLSSSPNPNGQLIRVHYKVVIPLNKINRVNQSEDVKKPSQKYIEIVTVDNYDFWFMGFFNYQKAHKYLQQALISQA